MLLTGLAGCETIPEASSAPRSSRPAAPAFQGSYHYVQRGETLWRIARSYGLEVNALARANRLRDASALRVGQKLFIPVPAESQAFFWPARGRVGRSGSSGVSISAPPGSLVRASRSGRVAVATHRLSGWGKAVVLDHLDGYLTVYAGLDQLLAAPGANLRQGVPLGSLGNRALHFEIRYGTTSRDTLALLPGE
ncbi:MAG: peptidoglycan DD-metalloendopeptidase family protein [Candidatus Omnitrophica bacterium]|nr:peptidoglycan DD-metalloendopeptidase family protein [Candidatus Omnitrophota bacterium]